ncbi:MAG: hypothetical protein GY842_03060, partial [bacterium]|nr:hypothetical protein [bacterium]
MSRKCSACFKLRIIGTAQSVPALANLLGEERLSHAARNTLEGMPCSEAGEALRNVLATSSGLTKVGLIDSLGWRRDPQAVPLLAPLMSDADAVIASAAVLALGRIGTPAAAEVLARALSDSDAEVRRAVAEACLDCADRLGGEDPTRAAQMYRAVLDSDLPGHLRGAALKGLAAQKPTISDLAASLKSEDRQLQIAAVAVVRDIHERQALEAVASSMSELPASAQTLLIHALADRGDGAALDAVTTACDSDDRGVRTAALAPLGALGNADSVPLLLQAAAGGAT